MRDVESLLAGRPPGSELRVFTGEIVRSDAAGAMVAPLGSDRRHPVGPCSGHLTYERVSSTAGAGDAAHEHRLVETPLPPGTRVLVLLSAGPPWIIASDAP